MSVQAAGRKPHVPSRRERAAAVARRALSVGIVAAAVAALAWLLVSIVAGTAFVVVIVATVAAAAVTAIGGRDVPLEVWGALAVAWAILLLERWALHGHGGVFVGAAAWLGVIAGARGAGIRRWALPLLAYPAISIAIVIAAGESLLAPWGISWLWLAAVFGPVIGATVLLRRQRA